MKYALFLIKSSNCLLDLFQSFSNNSFIPAKCQATLYIHHLICSTLCSQQFFTVIWKQIIVGEGAKSVVQFVLKFVKFAIVFVL